MSQIPVLIESSFADAITIIAAADELSEQTRRHWTTSLRQIAKALDKPLEVIPARYSAVRADLGQLHHAPAGVTAKTLQNHKSNVKSALLWLAREKGIPEHGAPLTTPWEELRAKIRDGLVRWRLSSLMRFCSANNITPSEVDQTVVDRFMSYRSQIGTRFDDPYPASVGPGLERQCRHDPGLAGAPSDGAVGQGRRGGGMGGIPRRSPAGC